MSRELSFVERANTTENAAARALFLLMAEKKSNLCLAADLTQKSEILRLADRAGPSICLLKTHVDIIDDFDWPFIEELQKLARKHHFLLFEDRKFADIGHTSLLQYRGGIYRIAEWAHFINAHTLPGPGIIAGLKEAGMPLKRGLLLLAQMSSKGALFGSSYTRKTVAMAEGNKDFVAGFIALKKVAKEPCFIHLTPGVKLTKGRDPWGQNWQTVEKVVGKDQTDVIIVGRDICNDPSPEEQAKLYQEKGWASYEKRLRQ